MAHHPIEFELTLEDKNGDEHEFLVKCTIQPGCAGYTSGPPEKCYPAEPPEVDDLRLYLLTGTVQVGPEKGKPVYLQIPEQRFEDYGVDYEYLENKACEEADKQAEAAAQDYDEREDD